MVLFSPHELKKLLKRYGIQVEELEKVDKVEFYLGDKKIVISSPQVTLFKMSGQLIYQVIGSRVHEEPVTGPIGVSETLSIPEEDIRFVMEQTNTTYEKAREALIKTKGDIVQAIMMLKREE